MLKIIFQALVIGILSTGIYMVFTRSDNAEYNPHYQKTRTNECLCIISIVSGVSLLLLLMTNKSDTIAVMEDNRPRSLNHKPPF